MKKILCVLTCIFCLFSLIACSNSEPKVLGTPSVTVSEDGRAEWASLEGAVSYEYKINGAEAISMASDKTALILLAGDTLTVRAIGDGEKYLDSDWSAPVTYNASIKLSKPTVITKDYGDAGILVTWNAVENASGYEYRLNGGAETPLNDTQFFISKNDTFYIRAVGDDEKFLDSDYAVVTP